MRNGIWDSKTIKKASATMNILQLSFDYCTKLLVYFPQFFIFFVVCF